VRDEFAERRVKCVVSFKEHTLSNYPYSYILKRKTTPSVPAFPTLK